MLSHGCCYRPRALIADIKARLLAAATSVTQAPFFCVSARARALASSANFTLRVTHYLHMQHMQHIRTRALTSRAHIPQRQASVHLCAIAQQNHKNTECNIYIYFNALSAMCYATRTHAAKHIRVARISAHTVFVRRAAGRNDVPRGAYNGRVHPTRPSIYSALAPAPRCKTTYTTLTQTHTRTQCGQFEFGPKLLDFLLAAAGRICRRPPPAFNRSSVA